MPKPENPEGPASIKVGNIPSDVRKKMWLLKRINTILGGPTEYKKMVVEALRYWGVAQTVGAGRGGRTAGLMSSMFTYLE